MDNGQFFSIQQKIEALAFITTHIAVAQGHTFFLWHFFQLRHSIFQTVGQMHTVAQEIAIQFIAVVTMDPECAAIIDLVDPEIQTIYVFPAFVCHIPYRDQFSAFGAVSLFLSEVPSLVL